ncbi:MAG: UbiA family prenyltransferase [Planctomycetes bacterium]|nr:UbiA family prenyltransferase [Planctomycetota bacterium]
MTPAATQRGATRRFRTYVRFVRPFTLLPPVIGMVSGSVTALGALAHRRGAGAAEIAEEIGVLRVLVWMAGGALLAAALNAGSNILNQYTDLAIDRINKPERPLPAGQVSPTETWALIAFFYALALALAAAIRPDGRGHTLWVVALGALLTFAYSLPPVRTKRHGTAANLTIAAARGCLLKVAGWSCIAAVFPDPEPWFLGGVFMLFLFGAAATKDFADMEGDRAAGCMTWPIRYGVRRAAHLVAPFLVLPWLLIPAGCLLPLRGDAPILSGNRPLLIALALALAAYGLYIRRGILRDPAALASTENHPSWTHVYYQMMAAQIGLMAAYLL